MEKRETKRRERKGEDCTPKLGFGGKKKRGGIEFETEGGLKGKKGGKPMGGKRSESN